MKLIFVASKKLTYDFSKTNFPKKQLQQLGLNYDNVHYQLSPNVLTEQTLLRKEGVLNSSGALCINTGNSPADALKTNSP